MKSLVWILLAFGLTGCGGWPYFLSPDVITQLKDDKASVCAVVQGGPITIGSGIIAFCRANSEGNSALTVTPQGNISVDHNKTPKK